MNGNGINSCAAVNGSSHITIASSSTSYFIYINNDTATRMLIGNGVIYSYLPTSQVAGTVGGNGYDYITRTYLDANDNPIFSGSNNITTKPTLLLTDQRLKRYAYIQQLDMLLFTVARSCHRGELI